VRDGVDMHCGRSGSAPMVRVWETGLPEAGVWKPDDSKIQHLSEVASREPEGADMTGFAAMETYAASPPHMKILLDPRYRCIGIGFSKRHSVADLIANIECDSEV